MALVFAMQQMDNIEAKNPLLKNNKILLIFYLGKKIIKIIIFSIFFTII